MKELKLTDEQIEIIGSDGNVKINACAGAAKTTSVVLYAKARPESKFLYLVFNKSAKIDAQQKFYDSGIGNVIVSTAHALAYGYTVPKFGYKVSLKGYSTFDILELFPDLNAFPDAMIVASHVRKFAEYFCGSMEKSVVNLNYRETLTTEVAKGFVDTHYEAIETTVRQFLAKMDKGQIQVTHDFYLKKFHSLDIKLPYDCILFDEGQDASAVMLDVFLNQDHVTKVIVGDTHQQIYGWRFAVNSLEKVDFTDYTLSKSFRFGEDIARLANDILGYKKYLGVKPEVVVHGLGFSKKEDVKATIARTNLGLIVEAIQYTSKNRKANVFFEGNIHSYTYAEDGTSLYDILNLFNKQAHKVKDKMLSRLGSFGKLKEYVETTSDGQMASMIKIVEEYGNTLPGLIKSLKDKHVEEKQDAEMIFSTVHKSKGVEYDCVTIANDFLTEDDIRDNKKDMSPEKRIEAINLLYVAITRTKNILNIHKETLPNGFKCSPNIKYR